MIKISDYLLAGKEHAISSSDLCRILKIKRRDLTAAVEKERREGKPICASTGNKPGYFLAQTREEMKQFCDSLCHRAGEIRKTRRACMAMLEDLPADEIHNRECTGRPKC